MRLTSQSPRRSLFPQEGREVPGVARHQDAPLVGREFEHLRVVERTEGRIRGQAHHVVAALFEGTADASRGQVGVEQETQPLDTRHVDERIERRQLVERARVVVDQAVDLLAVGPAVGLRQSRL